METAFMLAAIYAVFIFGWPAFGVLAVGFLVLLAFTIITGLASAWRAVN